MVLRLFFLLAMALFLITSNYADELNEFAVKRENDFQFQTKPTVQKEGDGFNITFETKSFCDVTIVVEEASSNKIVRHLVSGVLGSNAPEPLKKDSKIQKIYFDGKNDVDEYLKNIADYKVRVSLGLSPQFEKTLMDSPKRRYSQDRQIMQAIDEGVLVYDGGNGIESIKLYDFNGEYLRTLYPFSANKIKEIKGLKWQDWPDGSGRKFPIKSNFLQTSFLEIGPNFSMAGKLPTNYGWGHFGMHAKSVSFLAAKNKYLAFGMGYIARMGLDGSSLGMDINGPAVGFKTKLNKEEAIVQPNSAAISPDGKKIYFTAYHVCEYKNAANDVVITGEWKTYHHIYEMDLASNEEPKIFLGDPLKAGKDNSSFDMPISICIDDEYRIYVCDYLNNRVMVFDKDKKLLKSINIQYPAYVTVLPKSKDVVVVTYLVPNQEFSKKSPPATDVLLYNLGKFENMTVGKGVKLPKEYEVGPYSYLYNGSGFPLGLAITDASGELRVWVSREKKREDVITRGKIAENNIKIWSVKNGEFKQIRDFLTETEKELVDIYPIHYSRARLQVNPITGDLYTTRTIHGFAGKSFKSLFKIVPSTGQISIIDIPFDAEDFTFDTLGFLYLKSQDIVARYNVENMREVPWDYGVETKVAMSSSSDRKVGDIISGLRTPTFTVWHQGGIFVNVKGNILVSGQYDITSLTTVDNKYEATMFPGRPGLSRINNLLHIFDKYGKVIKLDVVPGLKDIYGVGLDQYNNVYVMDGDIRMIKGKQYPNDWTGTVMKFPFNGGRLLTGGDAPVPLPEANRPKRDFDVKGKWAEGASWFFGGVGFMGKNSSKGLVGGTGCACWNARIAFDYLNRTFVPELERYSVAILDSNGNVITRVGTYGNRDSAGPKSLVPIGGDEIAMAHGAYLATNTDKTLYIADIVNDRIIMVNLNYSVSETTSLPEK